ncbi:hypothetical protein I553_8102 [Mycobacterium xenopi 4042]|uniref:Uncharacterized protein n=1 Tax=Mycobacterium xenopi 4042 TaxID=1299334 RepID=X8DDZ9_MYCXE|nr:hypothetical protein I553_8102 [Mycobacterium xenopi 4042]
MAHARRLRRLGSDRRTRQRLWRRAAPRLLTRAEAARLRTLYAHDKLFRATVDMGRHRYGAGEYRYFREPYPEPIACLKEALYPRLLPIARDWWASSAGATRGRTASLTG